MTTLKQAISQYKAERDEAQKRKMLRDSTFEDFARSNSWEEFYQRCEARENSVPQLCLDKEAEKATKGR